MAMFCISDIEKIAYKMFPILILHALVLKVVINNIEILPNSTPGNSICNIH